MGNSHVIIQATKDKQRHHKATEGKLGLTFRRAQFIFLDFRPSSPISSKLDGPQQQPWRPDTLTQSSLFDQIIATSQIFFLREHCTIRTSSIDYVANSRSSPNPCFPNHQHINESPSSSDAFPEKYETTSIANSSQTPDTSLYFEFARRHGYKTLIVGLRSALRKAHR